MSEHRTHIYGADVRFAQIEADLLFGVDAALLTALHVVQILRRAVDHLAQCERLRLVAAHGIRVHLQQLHDTSLQDSVTHNTLFSTNDS